MKYTLILLALLSLGCAAKKPQHADVHAISRTTKYVATLSPEKAVKDSAKASKVSVKESAKLASFPLRHPKKSAKGIAKAGKQVF